MQFFQRAKDLRNQLPSNAVVLCDQNTEAHCLPLLGFKGPSICIPSGEEHKHLQTCEFVWNQLIQLNIDRSGHLVCLGGGVVTDLGAFAAATYMRGIKYTLVPTSLLAMVDAAIGSKCGVDFMHLKNYVGLFSRAEQILMCPEFLQTLPSSEWDNGFMEMLKHGLIADASHVQRIKQLLNKPQDLTLNDIQSSIRLKERHVEHDINEQGIRKRLNFGHTIGHAIESYALERHTAMAHGIAVGLGMLAESYLSHHYWSLSKKELKHIENILMPLLSKLEMSWLDAPALLAHMVKDKKNHQGKMMFTLLNSIGSAQENMAMDRKQVTEAIDHLKTVLA